MSTPTETVKNFYAALTAGDIPAAVNLMADDIEWITMLDPTNITGRGPRHVVEEMLKPLAQEWESYALTPSEFIADGDTVVSLGRFTCVHNHHRQTSRRPVRAHLDNPRRHSRPIPPIHRHPRRHPSARTLFILTHTATRVRSPFPAAFQGRRGP